jgi:hypothetical protein
MASKYSYARFRWWDPVNLDKAVEELSGFKAKKIIQEKGGEDISLYRDLRDEVEVEAKPFTARDMELREKVMKMYPRGRPTPFPWEFSSEPEFEKEKPEG